MSERITTAVSLSRHGTALLIKDVHAISMSAGYGATVNVDPEQMVSLRDELNKQYPITSNDPTVTRITDINDVQVGDIVVMKSGNHYVVENIDEIACNGEERFDVSTPEFIGNHWIKDSEFAYAIRPKPTLTTEPGLYEYAAVVYERCVNDEWYRLYSPLTGYMSHRITGDEITSLGEHAGDLKHVKFPAVES